MLIKVTKHNSAHYHCSLKCLWQVLINYALRSFILSLCWVCILQGRPPFNTRGYVYLNLFLPVFDLQYFDSYLFTLSQNRHDDMTWKVKSRVVCIQAIEAYRRIRGIFTLFLNLDSWWRWLVYFTPRLIYTEKDSLYPLVYRRSCPNFFFFGEGNNLITLSEFEPRIAQTVAQLRYQLRFPGSWRSNIERAQTICLLCLWTGHIVLLIVGLLVGILGLRNYCHWSQKQKNSIISVTAWRWE